MIGLLTIVGIVGALALCKRNQSVSDIGRAWYGGNSGYDGYSMSKRAREAREEGRFPKTDFKREYGMNDKVLSALLDFGIISNNEWHHTSKFGNKTKFYYWLDDADIDTFNNNKKNIQTAIRNYNYQFVADLFGVDYNDYGTLYIRPGDVLEYNDKDAGISNAVVVDVTPKYIVVDRVEKLGNGEFTVRDHYYRYIIDRWWKKVA